MEAGEFWIDERVELLDGLASGDVACSFWLKSASSSSEDENLVMSFHELSKPYTYLSESPIAQTCSWDYLME